MKNLNDKYTDVYINKILLKALNSFNIEYNIIR